MEAVKGHSVAHHPKIAAPTRQCNRNYHPGRPLFMMEYAMSVRSGAQMPSGHGHTAIIDYRSFQERLRDAGHVCTSSENVMGGREQAGIRLLIDSQCHSEPKRQSRCQLDFNSKTRSEE